MELEKADELVNSAYRRVQELDRFSRSSSPIGKAELATIALQALAELGALADWTVGPGITHSILQLLDENERQKFESFREFVKHAGEEDRPAAGQASSMSDVSGRAEMEIDPAPSGHSRMATEEEVLSAMMGRPIFLARSSRMRTWERGPPRPSSISSTASSFNGR